MVTTGIPKEKMTAYQRWEMASFDEVRPSERQMREQQQAEDNAQTIQSILKQVRQEAYEEGLKAGYADGMQQAEQQLSEERAQLMQLATGFSEALEMQDQQVADAVLTLALDLAKAMLKTELKVKPQAIIPVVLDAMHYLPQVKQPARLLLQHEDAKLVRAHLGDELKQQGWQVVEDASIERGGCIVETADNQIDASNAVRWRRITQGLSRDDDWHAPAITDSAAA